MVRVKLNPLSGELELVDSAASGYATGVAVTRVCDASVAVGDIVHQSATVDDKVETSLNNTDLQRSIGVVIEKPTATTAKVLVLGEYSGASGLTRGQEVWLSTTGTFTSTAPTTGYVQILGYAMSATKVFIEPNGYRAKRTP